VRSNVIELVDLTKKYGSFTAVDRLTLTIGEDEVFGLLGPNGAGKSTTILLMLGLTEPTSGIVRVCGVDSITNPVGVKKKVGYLPEDVGFYEDYTGFENLMLVWPQITGLIAAVILCFVLSYTSFMRREIRAR
jgi:ABC-2 type transport system ATP-binding protein